MKLKLEMTLLSDTIFGNGLSIPGGEDLSVLCDEQGFPYYKGGTFKGVFREELENYLAWQPELNPDDGDEMGSGVGEKIDVDGKLGKPGDDSDAAGKLRFYDFVISEKVKRRVAETIQNADEVTNAFTYLRTFTALDEEGVVKRSSLRSYRCVKAGITLEGAVECDEKDEAWVREILGLVKWIGTMRNRGFGRVKLEAAGGEK